MRINKRDINRKPFLTKAQVRKMGERAEVMSRENAETKETQARIILEDFAIDLKKEGIKKITGENFIFDVS